VGTVNHQTKDQSHRNLQSITLNKGEINIHMLSMRIEISPNDLVEVAASRGRVGKSETDGLFGINHEDCADL